MSIAEKIAFKTLVKSHCHGILLARIAEAQDAMNEAQEAANSNSKSSVGDKYETDRAMGQKARDLAAMQLQNALEENQYLSTINTDIVYKKAGNGAVVECDTGAIYFVAVGLGTMIIEDKKIIAISPLAPLAQSLRGLGVGDNYTHQHKVIKIMEVY